MDNVKDDLLKYNHNHLAIDSFGRRNRRRLGSNTSRSKKIFFKPHIDINPKKLQKIKKSITLYLDNKQVAVFNLNIWVLDIENKGYMIISKDANSSFFDIDIIKDKRTQNKGENILLWFENDFDLPSKIYEATTYKEIGKDDYHEIVLDRLLSSLTREKFDKDFHTDTIRTIVLLITIEDIGNVAYVLNRNPREEDETIIIDGSPIMMRGKSEDLIKLPFDKWVIHLNFRSRESNFTKKFLLNIKDWNNIEFKNKHRFFK